MKCNFYACLTPAHISAYIRDILTDVVLHRCYCANHVGSLPELRAVGEVLVMHAFQGLSYDTDYKRVNVKRIPLECSLPLD